MTERLAGVLRISDLTDASTSVERQRETIEHGAAARGATVVRWAEDLDVSATRTTPFERPQLSRLFANPDEWDTIAVWRLDRLVRNALQFSEVITWCLAHGKNLVSFTESIDIQTPLGRMVANITATFAEMEADAIRQRVTQSQSYLRRNGRWRGGPLPYGYVQSALPEGKGFVLVEDPKSAEVFRECARRVIAGASVLQVARELRDRGVPSPVNRRRILAGQPPRPDAPWRHTTLQRILRSETALGRTLHKGEAVRDDDDVPVQVGPALVDGDTWYRLQMALDDRSRPVTRRNHGVALLLGVAHCASCRGRLYIGYQRARGRPVRRIYQCTAGTATGRCSAPVVIAAEAAEEWTANQLLRVMGDSRGSRRVLAPGVDNRAEIAELEASLDRLETDRYERGGFAGEAGEARYLRLHGKYSARLAELRKTPYVPASVRAEPTDETIREWWGRSESRDARRGLLLHLGVRVTVLRTTRGARDVGARLRIDMGVLEYGLPEPEADPPDDMEPSEWDGAELR